MIYRCVDKALAAGIQMGLKDKYHRPHEPQISDEAKAWVVSLACTKPKDHALAAELWSISALARFVGENARAAGFPRLANAGIIRVVLDNHSAHISKETMTYLGSRPGRFEYVHTPKHGKRMGNTR